MLKKSVEEFKLELKKYKDNELLLLKYPDLYGPAEINEGELNVVDDMQNQINANKHRIGLLDSLNKKLSVSIKKLNEKRESIDQSFNKSNSKLDLNETNENYFMKQKDSRRASLNETPRIEKNALTRPVPLFKLENEMNQSIKAEK